MTNEAIHLKVTEIVAQISGRSVSELNRMDPKVSFQVSNVLDSLAIVRLLQAVETSFSISVEDDELLAGHFNSRHSLTHFIETKLSRGHQK